MADLSPAAQAVLDAAELAYNSSWGMAPSASHVIVAAAAALRAATDQVVPPIPDDCTADVFNRQLKIRSELLALATELEAQ